MSKCLPGTKILCTRSPTKFFLAKLMDELKVQVPAGRVDARDLDDHALPQLKTAPRVGTRQRERVLVKLERHSARPDDPRNTGQS